MLTAIKGIYNEGQVILEETPHTTGPVEVLVTFTKDVTVKEPVKKTLFGFAKGAVLYMSPDFNEPLEDLKNTCNETLA